MNKIAKNSIINSVEITGMADDGKCVAKIGGQVIFVRNAAPGDIVDLKIYKKKKSFLEANVINMIEPSKDRIDPFCSHFGICGGCKWQHISYEAQLKHKEKHVTDCLHRIGKVEFLNTNPILASAKTKYYRNKLEFTFSNMRWLTREEIDSGQELERNALGFHIPKRFDKILHIDHCYLQSDPSNDIRLAVQEYAIQNGLTFFDIIKQNGQLRNLLIRTTSTGEIMVILQCTDKGEKIQGLLSYLNKKFSSITSLMYVVNNKKNETFHDLNVECFSGTHYITEEMEGLQFRIGPKSFYQTNSEQAFELYKVARDFAGLTGEETVYDLYTGTGTIANFVAKGCKKVIGLEYIEDAIEDAKENSQLNKIENTSFFAGDMKDILNEHFISEHGKPDVVITDPPRAGMHADVIKTLLNAAPQKIVYISCNPATQARDIELMRETYEVKTIQPVDMFPHTQHVENVVLLVHRANNHYINSQIP